MQPTRIYWTLALLGLVGSGATGCTPFYQTTLATMPLVQHRGQLAVSGSWHVPETIQTTAAWSPVEHVRLSGALSTCHSGAAYDSTDSYVRGRQYEIGAGYYFRVSEGRGVVEVGGLYGQGYRLAHGTISNSPFDFFVPVGALGTTSGPGAHRGLPEQRGHFTTLGAQVGALWNVTDEASRQVGFVARLSRVQCTRLTVDDVAQPRPSTWYVEPTWVVRTRGKGARLEAQAGFSMALAGPTSTSVFYAGRPRLGVGIVAYPVVIYHLFRGR